jgi:hypothetical protein
MSKFVQRVIGVDCLFVMGLGWFGLECWVRFSVRVGFSDTRVDFLVDTGLGWFGLVWFGLVCWVGWVGRDKRGGLKPDLRLGCRSTASYERTKSPFF